MLSRQNVTPWNEGAGTCNLARTHTKNMSASPSNSSSCSSTFSKSRPRSSPALSEQKKKILWKDTISLQNASRGVMAITQTCTTVLNATNAPISGPNHRSIIALDANTIRPFVQPNAFVAPSASDFYSTKGYWKNIVSCFFRSSTGL